jgi:hypothetical protein
VCTHSLTNSPTYSPTHSPTYSPTYSPTHSPTYSPTYSLTHVLTHLLTHSLTHLLTHSLPYSLISFYSNTLWLVFLHLVGNKYTEIRERALRLVCVSISITSSGNVDNKLISLFESTHQGFDVLADQLAQYYANDGVVDGLLSMLFWTGVFIPRPYGNILTHSLTHSLTHWLTHSLTYSLTLLLTHSLTHSPTHSLTHLLTYLQVV